jgi:IS30 family transposase
MVSIDPDTRTRCLSELERSHIELRRSAGAGVREIARELARDPATVSREIARNGFTRSGYHPDGSPRGRWRYRARLAQLKAENRRRRPKTRRLAASPDLAEQVQTRLQQRWSPRQIAVTLRREHPEQPEMWVSHETIYQSLYVQGRGGLRAELRRQLRTGRALRKPRAAAARRRGGRSSIPEPVSISQRPAEVADRAVPGHWEGDLILGQDSASAIGTLVERSTRFCLLLHLPDGRGAEQVRDGSADLLLRPGQPLAAWDQREHQRAAAPVLPEGHRPVRPQRPTPGCGRRRTQRPTPRDPRLEDPRTSPQRATVPTLQHRRCCVHRVIPP